jgi:hypothetical protein
MGLFASATYGARMDFRAGLLCVCAGFPELRLDTVFRVHCLVWNRGCGEPCQRWRNRTAGIQEVESRQGRPLRVILVITGPSGKRSIA